MSPLVEASTVASIDDEESAMNVDETITIEK